MTTLQNSIALLGAACDELARTLDDLPKRTLSNAEIIEAYYRIMSVISAESALKQQCSDSMKIISRSADLRKRFNEALHSRATTELDDAIAKYLDSLDTKMHEKSENELKAESAKYDLLRQTMSTKEFVMQYEAGLKNE